MDGLYTRIKRATKPLRHGIIKLIAPTLYKTALFKGFSVPRPMTLFMMGVFQNRKLVGAEIGVASAENAYSMLSLLPIERFYAIDPYRCYTQNGEKLDYSEQEAEAHRKLKPFKEKVIWLRYPSQQAINFINEKLDFVYIDGNHQYEYVKADIELYYEKLANNGVLGGHDIQFPGVERAVKEFAAKHGKKVYSALTDWWIIK